MTQPLILRWKPWQRFTAAPHRTSSAPHSGSPKLDTRIVLSPKIHPPTLYLVVTTQDPTPLSPTAPDRWLSKKHLILLGGVRPWRTALLVICQYTGIGIFNGRSLKEKKKKVKKTLKKHPSNMCWYCIVCRLDATRKQQNTHKINWICRILNDQISVWV